VVVAAVGCVGGWEGGDGGEGEGTVGGEEGEESDVRGDEQRRQITNKCFSRGREVPT
jgi:hypothetical protein